MVHRIGRMKELERYRRFSKTLKYIDMLIKEKFSKTLTFQLNDVCFFVDYMCVVFL
jgi:hypothetical protein